MKNELSKIIAYVVVGVLLCTNIYQCSRGRATSPLGVYADTLTFVDTIPFYKPVPRDSVVIRYVTEVLPAVPKQEESVPTEDESVPKDSVSVQIPITQKVYRDSSYTAYVSGYRPSLDSITVYAPVRTIRIREKPKRWSVGVQVGYGVTVTKQPQFAPYIGVGVSYNLWNF